MPLLPPIPSTDYEIYLEISQDGQQWTRAPTTPIPNEEETFLVEVENDHFFRIVTVNKTTFNLNVSGTVEGKTINKVTADTVGTMVYVNQQYTADGFVRGNIHKEFKFSSTPLVESAATASDAKENLDKIGRIEMEITRYSSVTPVKPNYSRLPDDLQDTNAIWKESMKKRYGTGVVAGRTKNLPSVTSVVSATALSQPKRITFICRDKLGCIAERKERNMPIPEAEEAPALPIASSSSSSSSNNNNKKKRTRDPSEDEVVAAGSSSSSGQAPEKKMKLEKKSAAANEMSSWDATKVSEWIANLDPKFKALGYDKMFLEHDVDGVALQSLDREFLEQVGIKPIGHRAKIIGKVNEFKQGGTSSSGSSSSSASSSTPQIFVIE